MKTRDSSFKRRVIRILSNLKNEKKEIASNPMLPVYDNGRLIAYLRVASVSSPANKQEMANLARWRKMHAWWFTAQFRVTLSGTQKWFEEQVLKQEDRFLFIVETPSGMPFGHMGLYRFDFKDRSCEIDNVVRGENHQPGAMTEALKTFIDWTYSVLKIKNLYLRVFLDNTRAIKFYKRCGFQEAGKIPLKKIETNNRVSWVEKTEDDKAEVKRYFIRMKLEKYA